jgi:CRP-like cAMP-binding protein
MSALRAHARIFREGQLICLEGEPSRSIIFMIKGAIGVYRKEKLIRVLRGEQMFVGYIAFFGGRKRTATLKAKADCEILLIPEDKIESTLGIAPTLALRLTRDATELLLERDNELERYRTLGAAAQNAMTQKKLAHFVEEARQGAAIKEKMEKLLPALVVSLLTKQSERVSFHVVKELLDTLEPHLDPDAFSFDADSIKAATSESIVGESLAAAMDELVKRQEDAETHRQNADEEDPESAFKAARKTLRAGFSGLWRRLNQSGQANLLEAYKQYVTEIDTELAQRRFDRVLELIESALNELSSLHKAELQSVQSVGLSQLLEKSMDALTKMHTITESIHGVSLSHELESGVFDRIKMGLVLPDTARKAANA